MNMMILPVHRFLTPLVLWSKLLGGSDNILFILCILF